MKKFLSLLLALAMLCALPASFAEETAEETNVLPMVDVVTPLPFVDYQQHLSEMVNSQIPDTVITWETLEESPGVWMAVAQGAMMGIVCTVEEDLVDEVMFVIQGELEADMIQVFMGMSAYALGAVATFSGMAVEDALYTCINGVSTELQNTINGAPTYMYGGKPLYIIIAAEEDGSYTMQMVLDLIPEDAAAE